MHRALYNGMEQAYSATTLECEAATQPEPGFCWSAVGVKEGRKVFGWSALWSTIPGTSIWKKKLCSSSKPFWPERVTYVAGTNQPPTSYGCGPEIELIGRPSSRRFSNFLLGSESFEPAFSAS